MKEMDGIIIRTKKKKQKAKKDVRLMSSSH